MCGSLRAAPASLHLCIDSCHLCIAHGSPGLAGCARIRSGSARCRDQQVSLRSPLSTAVCSAQCDGAVCRHRSLELVGGARISARAAHGAVCSAHLGGLEGRVRQIGQLPKLSAGGVGAPVAGEAKGYAARAQGGTTRRTQAEGSLLSPCFPLSSPAPCSLPLSPAASPSSLPPFSLLPPLLFSHCSLSFLPPTPSSRFSRSRRSPVLEQPIPPLINPASAPNPQSPMADTSVGGRQRRRPKTPLAARGRQTQHHH